MDQFCPGHGQNESRTFLRALIEAIEGRLNMAQLCSTQFQVRSQLDEPTAQPSFDSHFPPGPWPPPCSRPQPRHAPGRALGRLVGGRGDALVRVRATELSVPWTLFLKHSVHSGSLKAWDWRGFLGNSDLNYRALQSNHEENLYFGDSRTRVLPPLASEKGALWILPDLERRRNQVVWESGVVLESWSPGIQGITWAERSMSSTEPGMLGDGKKRLEFLSVAEVERHFRWVQRMEQRGVELVRPFLGFLLEAPVSFTWFCQPLTRLSTSVSTETCTGVSCSIKNGPQDLYRCTFAFFSQGDSAAQLGTVRVMFFRILPSWAMWS